MHLNFQTHFRVYITGLVGSTFWDPVIQDPVNIPSCNIYVSVYSVGTAMMPQYYNAGQTPWGIYLATPVAPQTPQATPPGQPTAPLLRGQHTVTARPMTPIQTATPLDDSGTPQMHTTPGVLNV